MNNVISLLSTLKSLGIKLALDEKNNLVVRGDKAALTPLLIDKIKQCKQDVVAFLSDNKVKKPLVKITTVDRNKNSLQLSFAQQRLWLLDKIESNSAYNVPGSLKLSGELNYTAVEKAFNTIIQRHESLRTCFIEEHNEPVQVIKEFIQFDLIIKDLSQLEVVQRTEALSQAIEFEGTKGFDLCNDLMLRVQLLKLTNTEHVLLVTMHHIASDGWSMALLIKEFSTLYSAFSQGLVNPLIPLNIQYADYAHWQRSQIQVEILDLQLKYWTKQLADLPLTHSLPLDKARPKVQSFKGCTYYNQISKFSHNKLSETCTRHGATLFMGLHAAFSVLLSRYSNEKDIVIGSPIANREQIEIEHLIGFFVNNLVLRCDLSGNPSFNQLLIQSKNMLLDAYAHQQVPFEKIVEKLKPERSLSHSPLFQVMLVLQNNERSSLELPGLTLSSIESEENIAKYDLTLNIINNEGSLELGWEYNSDLFKAETISSMSVHFEQLLTSLLNAPDESVFAVKILNSKQQYQQVVEWNNTLVNYPQNKCIHELFEKQAEKNPHLVAVVFEGTQLSYGELNRKSNQLAYYLIQEKHIKPDTLIGICIERSVEMVIGILAILKAGGAYVPLDPDYPAARLNYMLQDAELSTVLTLNHHIERTPINQHQAVCLDDANILQQLNEYSVKNIGVEKINLHPKNLAYVIYTSGSTGQPKGVLVQHSGLVNLTAHNKKLFDLKPSCKFLNPLSIGFDAANGHLWDSLCAGATVYLVSASECLFSQIESKKISHAVMPAAVFKNSNVFEISSLKVLMVGGDIFDPSLIKKLGNKTKLFNLYGPTETTVISSCSRVVRDKHLSIGKPIDNTTCYILNNRELAPVGVTGELHIGGVGLARGYLNRTDLTNEKFISNPFYDASALNSSQRLYKTGDLVRWLPDGNLEFIGRIDNQVKIRGFRIELGEIEQVLNEHVDVKGTAVLAKSKAGVKNLVAYIMTTKAKEFEEDEPLIITKRHNFIESLRKKVSQSLPEHMIPSVFVLLQSFPLTTHGKLDYKALPEPDYSKQQKLYIPPSTEIEKLLCDIWQDTLSLKRIGITDNFFELGGHSLLATRLISQINKALDLDLELKVLFSYQTIKTLAPEILKLESGSIQPKLSKVSRDQKLKTSFAQQRLWLLDKLDGGSSHYNMPAALKLSGKLNYEALKNAFNCIITRHESLRTCFSVDENGEPIQIIQDSTGFRVVLNDLTQTSVSAPAILLKQCITDETVKVFDLTQDFMLRVKLLKLAVQEHILLITMHHIASDGWSMGLLIKEFSVLYDAFVEDKVNPLTPLDIQYADYAHWQRNWLQGDVLASQLNYWAEQLADLPQVHNLPLSGRRPEVQTFNGYTHFSEIGHTQCETLNKLCLSEGATLFMGLHAAFSVLLARYSNETDIVMGSPIANREQAELNPLIGFFVNNLVLRSDLSGNLNFRGLLKQSKKTLLNAYAHQQVPFEKIVEKLQPERNLSHSPLFQVMLVLQNNEQENLTLPGLSLSQVGEQSHIAKYDLTLNIIQNQHGLSLGWEYNTDLFNKNTISGMASHFEFLLKSLLSDLNVSVLKAPMLSDKERFQQLTDWNNTAEKLPKEKCIHQLFEDQVINHPDAIAIVFENTQLTYTELNQKANQLAGYLIEERNVKSDTLVGIYIERSVEMVIGILAILKAGGAYVPLDPDYPQTRINYMLQDASLATVITLEYLMESNAIGVQQTVCLDDPVICKKLKNYSTQNINAGLLQLSPNHLAYVIYTSGSTGQPKGVLVQHSGLVNLVCFDKKQFELKIGSKLLNPLSIGFDAANGYLWDGLCAGATVYLASGNDCQFSLIKKNQISHAVLPAALLNNSHVAPVDSLKVLIAGGDTFDTNLIHILGNNTKLFNVYGPTEATVTSTYSQVLKNEKLTIGTPIANVSCYILNDETLVPTGVVGELHIGGAGLARGYLNLPDLTAEKFINNPFFDSVSPNISERLYKSGDLVRRLPDGNIEFIGRIDHQVKIRGFRIELGEIELTLEGHTDVKKAVVLAKESKLKDGTVGETGNKSIVAYVITDQAAKLIGVDEEVVSKRNKFINALREEISQNLPEQMMPSAFVLLECLPLTAHGKVDHKSLPEPDFSHQQSVYSAPSTKREKILCEIWQTVLNVERVGLSDNFFELGGHSLLATRLVAKINQELGLSLAMKVLFSYQTIETLMPELLKHTTGKNQPELVPISRKGQLVSSFSQQRLWFLAQMESGSSQYNMAHAFHIKGDFDIKSAEIAFNRIIERHETLRTVFVNEGMKPVQIIKQNIAFSLDVIDFSHVSKEEQERNIEHEIKQESDKSFDLANDLMLRASVIKLAEQEIILLLTLHHIASDGWSMGVLLNEFSLQYQSVLSDEIDPLTPLSIQYADYAHWQNEHINDKYLAQKIEFWLDRLHGIPQVHSLPLDNQRQDIKQRKGEQYTQYIDHEITNKLKHFSLDHKATLFMTLQAAFAAHLSRWSNETDIVMGAPIAGREHPELQSLIGLFLNTQVFRTDLSDNPSFAQLLLRTREDHLNGAQYNEVPFELLVESLNPARSLKYTPVFQVLINMDNNPDSTISLPGFAMSFFGSESENAFENKYDLTLYIKEYQENGRNLIRLTWAFDSELFNLESITNTAKEFSSLLKLIMEEPQTQVLAHNWSVGNCWNEVSDIQKIDQNNEPSNILELFDTQVKRVPEHDAIVTTDSKINYKTLDEQANQIAQMLQSQHNIKTNDKIAIAMTRSVDRIVVLLAVMKLGAAYVPLTQELPIARIAMMLEDSETALILTDKKSAVWSQEFESITKTVVVDDEKTQNKLNNYSKEKIIHNDITDNTISHLIFTSGSTGRPKAVLGNHSALFNRVNWMLNEFPFKDNERASHITSMAFIRGVWELWVPLCAGVPLELFDREVVKDPKSFIHQLQQRQVSRIVTAPSLMSAIYGYLQEYNHQLENLNFWFVSGEALSKDLSYKMLCQLPHIQFVNLYGSTEVLSDVLFHPISQLETSHYVPLGKPISGVATTIIDGCGNPVPLGVVGELIIVGKSVTLGYSGLKELTEKQFISTPVGKGYRTGDLVRMTVEGDISYIGRIDHQLKIRGHRIELSEVEYHLNQLSLVKDAAVVAFGQEDKYLVAYFTLHASQKMDDNILQSLIRSELSTLLPTYMMPSFFVKMSELPLTPNGKINRKALLEPDKTTLIGNYESAQSKTEKELVKIWSVLLEIKAERISIRANFFELGGHSLLSMRLITEVKNRLYKEITVRDIFEHSQLAQLAHCIDQLPIMDLSSKIIKMSKHSRYLPTSFSQQRLWFLDQMDSGSVHYNIPVAIHVEGNFSVEIAQQAFNQVVARHEPLRTVFKTDESGQAVQIINEQVKIKFQFHDVSSAPERDQKNCIDRLINQDRHTSFDLTTDAMLRAGYIKISDTHGVLMINIHHIASDGWSTRLVIKEFSALYQDMYENKVSTLPPLEICYSDYAYWQRDWFSKNLLETQLNYWKQQLAGLPEVHNLPLAQERPQFQSFTGANHHFFVDDDVHNGLIEYANSEEITLFMLLHSVFALVLSRHSSDSDIVIGTPIANRHQKELESIVGFFANTIVLRVDCSSTQGLKEYLAKVKHINLEAQTYQETPFEYLVDQLQPLRSTSYSPLFQIMFSMDTNDSVALTLPEVSLKVLEATEVTSKYELTLNVTQMRNGLAFNLEYNTDLFESEKIIRIGEHINELLLNLLSLASKPDVSLDEVTTLSQQEQNYLIKELNQNDVQSEPNIEASIHQLFSHQALISPDHTALECNGKYLSYRELDLRSNQLANYLIQQGVTRDTLVGVCLERSVEMIIGLLGILKSGAAYVPLDSTYPANRLAYMIQDSGMKWVLTQGNIEVLPDSNSIQYILIDDSQVWQSTTQSHSKIVIEEFHPQTLAYVIYTSGSTGQPKGVMIEHASMSKHVQSMKHYLQLTTKDNVLQFASMSFDTFVEQTFAALIAGSCLHLRDDKIWSNEDFYQYCHKHQISVTDLSPAYLMELLRESESSNHYWKQTSIRELVVGGESLLTSILTRWQQLELADRCRLINAYGPTEATITSSISLIDVNLPIVPIGKAFGGRQLFVLDENQKLVPFGAIGELYIGGEYLARGYLNNSLLTEERFIQCKFYGENSIRLYRTGDRVKYLSDGQLTFLGRMDEQIKIRGFRIEPEEIEQQISQLTSVNSAIVKVINQDDKHRLAAYLILKGNNEASFDTTQDLEDIKSSLAKVLPEYMLPSSYIVMTAFPVLPNGKIDKKALPAPVFRTNEKKYQAAKSDIEKTLVLIWADLLNIEPSKIGVDDNFFSLGGDSILSIQLVSKARQTGIILSIKDIFEFQSIRQLAVKVKSNKKVDAPQQAIVGSMTLLPIQYEFFEDEVDLHHFNQAVLLTASDLLTPNKLKSIVYALVRRHDALRLQFNKVGNSWQAHHCDINDNLISAAIEHHVLPGHDFSLLTPLAQSAQQSLSFDTGFLFKALLFTNELNESRVLLIVHHLVVDGVSWRILLNDFDKLCQSSLQGEELSLAEKTSSFSQWSSFLQDYRSSDALQAERSYWLNALATDLTSINIPKVVDSAKTQGGFKSEPSNCSFELSTKMTKLLVGSQSTLSAHAKTHELILASVLLGFQQWSGQTEVQVDLEGHGREPLTDKLDLTQTLGWFTSIYPLRLKVIDNQLGKVISDVVSAYRNIPNNGIGFGILKYLNRDSDFDNLPQSSILFNYLGQFDQMVQGMGCLSMSKENMGQTMSAKRKQTHELIINSLISSGCLKFNLGFNLNQYSEHSIKTLLNCIEKTLVNLITHNATNPIEIDDATTATVTKLLGQVDSTHSFDKASDCIIKLNQGSEQHKIFSLHPLGGTVGCYAELSKEVEPLSAFYGVQAPAMTSGLRLLTIESLASYYIRAIKTAQPDGPYNIIGWSLGGSLAYEVAAQLKRKGDEISYLALLDESPVTGLAKNEQFSWYQRIKGMFKDNFDWSLIESQEQQNGIKLLVEQAMENGFAPESVEAEVMQGYFQYLVDVSLALNHYSAPLSDLSFDLFKVAIAIAGNNSEPDYGWQQLTTGDIQVHQAQGVHSDMINQPYVKSLGNKLTLRLQGVLNKLNDRQTSLSQ